MPCKNEVTVNRIDGRPKFNAWTAIWKIHADILLVVNNHVFQFKLMLNYVTQK